MSEKIWFAVVLALSIALPVLGIANCDGWTGPDMIMKQCYVGGEFALLYAQFYANLLVYSLFTFGTVLGFYLLMVYLIFSFGRAVIQEYQ